MMKHFAPLTAVVLVFISLASESNCAEPQGKDYAGELPRISAVEPADVLDTLVVEPGFQLELVASEPLVNDPVAMSFDEHGRLFVAEMRGYSENADDYRGVIRLLIDDDKDGKFDRSTIYVDKLSWPTAVCCYDGGVFVGVAPDILYCKDTDGDGKADIRERIFTGFSRSNVQGLFNSFQWALDNRLHGATSTVGGSVRKIHEPEEMAIMLRGRDFSFDPAKLDLRAESGGAQHGMNFDRWGRKFNCSNSDHLRAVVIPDRYLARNPYFAFASASESIAKDGPQAEVYRISDVEPWRVVRTRLRVAGEVPGPVEGGGRASGYFTSATGVTIYDGDAWPAEYREGHYAIVGDVGSNIIHRKRIDPNGVSFIGERIDEKHEFIASNDIWFRPVQFANGPDGALYVADFYREVIEHPKSLPPMIKKHLDLNSGRDRGRIYRVVPEGFKHPERKLPGEATNTELVAMLEHANGWHRLTALRLLIERQDMEMVKPIESLAAKSKSPLGRSCALDALAGLGRLTPQVVLAALADTHPRARERAVLHAGNFIADEDEIREKLLTMTNDKDQRVRFQLALSLGESNDPSIATALAELLVSDGADRWIRDAVISSSAHVVEPLIEILQLNKKWAGTDPGKSALKSLTEIATRKQEDNGEALEAAYVHSLVSQPTEVLHHEAKKGDVIERYRLSLGDGASVERGAAIFKKTCASCHDVNQNEGGIAPSVASYRNRGVEGILVNIIDPNREVNPQYLNYTLLTVDGIAVSGMITAETATSITLTAARDTSKTVLRIDVDELESSGMSLMPENLEKEINEQQMADLLAFLLSGG